ncbi:hypothetical protein [Clostridium estertheticum]|uniref:hypothetical protein n=1 Tax=Clostridium estertheticum TaxID=238834 RepID=UPI001C0C7EDD|nr:hypothetical protein [Clostridium estertheticum]MBU3073878.1 hypothetical protein [Clostridium estertheticum]MBU3163973.1 hypothetical protein [Clostridium estertheticum]
MPAMLYLPNKLRTRLKDHYELFINTYVNRIAPVFSTIEHEADKIRDDYYQELGENFNPERDNEADCAELAVEKGFNYYEGMSLMQYNTKLMWISTVYEFWEQQIRKFLYGEITRSHKFYDKKDNESKYKDFCTKGIDDIKATFLWFDYNLELQDSWKDINELRLLTNVIKHGDGWSATELQKNKPLYFKDDESNINRLELYRNTLNNVVLNVQEKDFVRYCKSLAKFWDELPERLSSISD